MGTPFRTVRSFVALKEQLKQSDSGVTWGQFQSSGGGISEKNASIDDTGDVSSYAGICGNKNKDSFFMCSMFYLHINMSDP